MQLDTIGKNIRKYRLMKKFRQEDLAEKAGLTTNYIGMVERGEKIPSLETFIKILNALEVSSDMVLADVLETGYTVKNSILNEKLAKLAPEDRSKILCIFSFQNGIGFYFCNAAKLFFCKVFKGYFPLPPLALSRRYWKAKSSGFFYSVLPKSIESRICHHLSFLLNVITAWHIKPNTREKQPPPNSDAPHPAPDIVIKPPTKKIPMPRNIPTP